KRAIEGFSNTETNLPSVLERLGYMAGYVRNAIADRADRVARVDELMHEANALYEAGKLTFQEATRLFDGLVIACDNTMPLSEKLEPIPEDTLNKHNIVYLGIPKGNLKISRFVDTYLSQFPLHYIAVPNQRIEEGPHGTDYSIYDFVIHDRGHSNQGDGAYWEGFQRISNYRDTLSPNDFKRKCIDAFLFWYFHESRANSDSLNSEFTCGIDQMRNMSTVHDHISIDIIGTESISDFHGAQQSLGEFLIKKGTIPAESNWIFSGIKENDSRIFLEVSYAISNFGKLIEIPCSITFDGDIVNAKELVPTAIQIDGEVFSCLCGSKQRKVSASYADLPYLLKYARKTDVPERVTVDNYQEVMARFNAFMDEAADLIKANA
ncbi:MAG: hypothetical protein NTW22_06840, partial [Proteobacteria bacterium]|nr:hypothetical protein [Pseudomonadota bacterium]